MSRTSIAAEVQDFIRRNFFYEGPDLDPSASFMEGGILDSTGVLELVAFLEERYGIKIDDADLTPDNLDSLSRIEAFLQRKAIGQRA